MPALTPRLRRLAATTATLLAAGLATTAVAHASPFEQISRDTGALGGSPLYGFTNTAAAVGDVGRYAGFERARSAGDYGPTVSYGFVRDIQTNTTIDYGGGVQRIYSIDRAEQRALIGRTRGGQFQIVAVPIAGGSPLIVAQVAATTPINQYPEAALSGDGRKVVYSLPSGGTYLVDLTGGKVGPAKLLSPLYLRFQAHGLSDNASVVIGINDFAAGAPTQVLRAGTVTPINTYSAAVSGDSTTIAYISAGTDLVLRNLLTGVERRFAVSGAVRNLTTVLRAADRGAGAVVTGPGSPDDAAALITPGAGTAFTAKPFGGRYATSLVGDDDFVILSASGRFAETRSGNQVSIVDTTDTHIVGANDGFSAASYVSAGSFVSQCDQPAQYTAYMKYPSKFGPKASKMTVLATGGGQTIASGTITNSLPDDASALYIDTSGPGWKVTGTYDPTKVHAVLLKVTVTDAAGRNLMESWTEVVTGC